MKAAYPVSPAPAGDPYRATRFLYIVEAALEYFINLLLTGAYLAKVAGAIGMSGSAIGIVTSIVSLGTSFQFLAVFLSHRTPVKRWVTVWHTVNQLLLACVWLTPLFPVGTGTKAALFVGFLLVGYAINHVINSPKISWYMAAVPDGERGRFTAKKEIVSLVGGTAFTLLLGNVFDRLEAAGKQQTAFLVGAVTMLVLALLHTLTLLCSREKTAERRPAERAGRELSGLLRNRRLVRVLLIGMLYSAANGLVFSFYGTYQVNELGFSMSFIALQGALHTAVRCVSSVLLGRYADRHSFAAMLRVSVGMLFLGELVMVFTVPANGRVLYTVYHAVFLAVFGAGYGNGMMNLTYDTVAKEQRMSAFALYNCASGLVGFLASLPGSLIVSAIQENGNRLLGHPVYAQQLLSLIGAVLIGVQWLLLWQGFREASEEKRHQKPNEWK